MIFLAVGWMVLCVVILWIPFFWGSQVSLQAAVSLESSEELDALKKAIVDRYVEEEKAFSRGDLSKRTWTQRQEFLFHRYVDVAKRKAWLSSQAKQVIQVVFIFCCMNFMGIGEVGAFPKFKKNPHASGKKEAVVVLDCKDSKPSATNHAILFESGVDEVYGSYWVHATNDRDCAEFVSTELRFPKQVFDWRVQEGVDPQKDVELLPDGRVRLKKKLAPGEKAVMAFGIKVRARQGMAYMDFPVNTESHSARDSLAILVPSEGLKVAESDFVPVDQVKFGEREFIQFTTPSSQEAVASRPLFMSLRGVAEGRSSWQWAWAVGLMILSTGTGLLGYRQYRRRGINDRAEF